jgi:hypothetical protein
MLEKRTLEVFSQLGQGVPKDLAYAPLGQLQGFADLFEGKALVEIEGCDEPFPILEPTYGVDELGTQIHEVSVGLRIDRRDVRDERTVLYTLLVTAI